jgi:uncharacterized protein
VTADHGSVLRGRRALVTGAAGGLGAAIVRRLSETGATVVATDCREAQLRKVASAARAEPIVCDLADRRELGNLVEIAATVDALVCCAGLPATGPLDDFTTDQIDRAVDVNLRAPMLLARAAGCAMVSRGHGHIVFISSMGAKVIGPALGVYAATKAGVRALALAMREDLRREGVGVSVVLPGPIREAGMWAEAGVPLPRGSGRARHPGDVAEAVLRAIETNAAEVEVASLSLRVSALVAGLRPTWLAALGRRGGADEIAATMTAAFRTNR